MQNQDVYTTGDAARLLGVSQQLIIRQFDSGALDGFKIPGSNHRRIPREKLLKYTKAQGHKATKLLETSPEKDVFSTNKELLKILNNSVKGLDLAIKEFGNGFDLGIGVFQVLQHVRFAPRILIIDLDSWNHDLVVEVLEKIKENKQFSKTALWAMTEKANIAKGFASLEFDKIVCQSTSLNNISHLFTDFDNKTIK